MEGGATSQKMQVDFEKFEREIDYSLELLEEIQEYNPFDLQSCKTVYVCCFKPLN